jgi:hypothetical protein
MQGLLNFRATISSQGVFCAREPQGQRCGRVLKNLRYNRPQALTHTEMADQLSKAAGKPLKYVDVTPDAAWQANGLVEGLITQTVRGCHRE